MAEPVNRVFNDRYELESRIARGGMAEVYLARDPNLDRSVALKVLFPEFATDPSFVQRFRREAQNAANLVHPNIVQVFDWGEADGTYFIVMEYVNGRSLAQIIAEEGALRPDRAVDIAADVAAALGSAHRSGVIHRDIKPGNVLVTPAGQVKVADFGIARAVSTQENLTQTGTVMGTATYFSPEQARGEQVDNRSDVYSLGVVLYEMLAGRPPFAGDSPVAVAYKHVQEAPEPVRIANPRIPAGLEAITMKALAKNPANRYASAEEMRADLLRFQAGQPVLAEPILPPPAATERVRVVTPTPVPVRAEAATRMVPAYERTRAVRTVERDERYYDEPPRRSAGFIVLLILLLAILVGLLVLLADNLGIGGDDSTVEVTVPSVLSLDVVEATRVLNEAGLEVESTEVDNDTVPAGQVFGQDPAAGTIVAEDTVVQLQVSAGLPPVVVPSLVTLTEAEARSLIENLGLVADVRPIENETVEAGLVVTQNPAPGTELPAASTVVIEVSSGPPLVAVPEVAGQTVNQASITLANAGFGSSFQEEPSNDVPEGQVTRTDPPVGTEVPKGDTIAVFVSSGPSTTAVPNVLGATTADATATLQAAGFGVVTQSRAVEDPADDGVVVEQIPAPDAQAEPGSTVTIIIGSYTPPSTTTVPPTTTTVAP